MSSIRITRADSSHADFLPLVELLNADLAIRDGDVHDFYQQFNGIEALKNVVIAYENNVAVGCGAFKEFDTTSVEIKRMYTKIEARGKGLATVILTELETWASELNYTSSILETGVKQPEAIALYKKNGYTQIPNYAQYSGLELSVCFLKKI
ncbi:MAG: GNAT family N-acetyltransferase [Crocinitomicaceae bacterium]|nr:GNAT family N-acetyltransferase [Crocinitomicaceae bacterium]